jgi:cytochrome c oxidase subunit I+III
MTGRMLSERLARWQFWLFFVAFNVTFYPMHHLGLAGMPRRIYTYAAETGWGLLNLVATIGAVGIGLSVLLFLVNVAYSLRAGERAPDNPWGGSSLEWGTPSPPPAYNFASLPVVSSREPLWMADANEPTHVMGLSAETREGLVTTVIDALPDVRYDYPEPTVWPFIAAVAVWFWLIWSIFSAQGLLWGMIPPAIAFIGWYWPSRKEVEEHRQVEVRP